MGDWTLRKVERLKELWMISPPVRVQAIADELAMSYAATKNKAHRLGLPSRPSPIRRAPLQPPGIITVAGVQIGRQKPSCSWPEGNPKEKNFHFCGAAAEPHKPYCRKHFKQAHPKYRFADEIGARAREMA